MAQGSSSRLRARHDAGRPPYLRRRVLVLLGSIGVTTGLTVTGAGLFRQGPLAWLFWSEQVLAPQQVLVSGPADTAVRLQVAVRWTGAGRCPALEVEADQDSSARVVIRRVVSQVPRLTMPGRSCNDLRPAQDRIVATLNLEQPLHGRQVVDGAGHLFEIGSAPAPG